MRAEHAYTHIKRLILEGHFQAGDRLAINSFVQQLGISRQPVARALARLADEGMVEIVPRVGCWVARVAPAEIGDLFRLFAATEALAAERRTLAELEAPHAVDRRIAAFLAAEPGNIQGYRMLNRAFHGQVHAMAHSATLHDAGSSMWDRCDFFLCTLGRNFIALRVAESHAEHAKIAEASARQPGNPCRTTSPPSALPHCAKSMPPAARRGRRGSDAGNGPSLPGMLHGGGPWRGRAG